ncbi:hypothetical protein DSO57_1009987 [Entomophthora muscae]|uniref:Uncharacterized protein n=1 Tax=Entomophthora muscae TaxID=34485 RepID=A0ACC2RLE9_9FUNG|nr:hypothetical protein DSO57_1009987 [Entomophthora muscae]
MISRFINKKYSSKDFKMSLESYYTYDGFDMPILCIKYEIMRHICKSKYDSFVIKIIPPGTKEIALCGSGIEGCCAADYCFEYVKKGWFSFDMKITFPNKKEIVDSIIYNLGEMTNHGPWAYTSIETVCVNPDYASLD